MAKVTKLYSAKVSAYALDSVLDTHESVASTPDGSTIYIDIDDAENLDLPPEVQDLLAEAESLECSTVELYR